MNINTARTLANMLTKAVTLFTDGGYTLTNHPSFPDTFFVKNPAGESYTVVLSTEGSEEKCTCPAFPNYGDCKHLMAVRLEVAKDEAMIAEYEAEEFGRFAMEADRADRF